MQKIGRLPRQQKPVESVVNVIREDSLLINRDKGSHEIHQLSPIFHVTQSQDLPDSEDSEEEEEEDSILEEEGAVQKVGPTQEVVLKGTVLDN